MLAARRRSLVGLTATVVLIAVSAWLLPRLHNGAPAPANDEKRPSCDLNRGSCTVAIDDVRRIDFSISPRPIPVMTPLTVQLSTFGFVADTAQVDFTGIGMDMGYNRVMLVRQTDGRLTGQTSLPVCVSGNMDWQAAVLLTTADSTRPRHVIFRFSAPAPTTR